MSKEITNGINASVKTLKMSILKIKLTLGPIYGVFQFYTCNWIPHINESWTFYHVNYSDNDYRNIYDIHDVCVPRHWVIW